MFRNSVAQLVNSVHERIRQNRKVKQYVYNVSQTEEVAQEELADRAQPLASPPLYQLLLLLYPLQQGASFPGAYNPHRPTEHMHLAHIPKPLLHLHTLFRQYPICRRPTEKKSIWAESRNHIGHSLATLPRQLLYLLIRETHLYPSTFTRLTTTLKQAEHL